MFKLPPRKNYSFACRIYILYFTVTLSNQKLTFVPRVHNIFSEYHAMGTLYPSFFSEAWYSTLKYPERDFALRNIPLEFPARCCSHKLKVAEAVGLHQWFSFACEKDVFLFAGIIYQSHTCILGYSRKITFRDEIFHPSGYSFFSNTPRSRYKLIIILLRGCNSEVQLLIGYQ